MPRRNNFTSSPGDSSIGMNVAETALYGNRCRLDVLADVFVQFTDARPDTGGLSGATPSEAVSWGKIDPNQLPDAIVAYADSTMARLQSAAMRAETSEMKRQTI
jgi:deoxyhypusine synthase